MYSYTLNIDSIDQNLPILDILIQESRLSKQSYRIIKIKIATILQRNA